MCDIKYLEYFIPGVVINSYFVPGPLLGFREPQR